MTASFSTLTPHWIAGQASSSDGPVFASRNPSTGEVLWEGPAADRATVDAAVQAARKAFPAWTRLSCEARRAILERYGKILEEERASLEELISAEVGKPRWEARTEVQAMIGKIALSVQAQIDRASPFEKGPAKTRFKPHGVVAVFGPFNFPGHLPNGHIVPALLAGNTIVYKPSEQAPRVAARMVELLHQAELPPGVLNLVQGARETGEALAGHAGIDGLFFTGSARVGQFLSEQFGKTPQKILALELGGNNPLVVWDVRDVEAAALLTVQSAYLTAGQRCTCARRLILPQGGEGDRVLMALREWVARVRVGPPTDEPEPFCGPVISEEAANAVLAAQEALRSAGAEVLVEARHLKAGTGLVSPGLLDVTGVANRSDEEVFGPLLQVIRVPDFDAAIAEANATAYGLAAGLLSDSRELYERFWTEVRAGLVNWNQQLTGASGAAPFGGVGLSGNHRPSGYFAADYCAYPVASIENETLLQPEKLPPGIEPA